MTGCVTKGHGFEPTAGPIYLGEPHLNSTQSVYPDIPKKGVCGVCPPARKTSVIVGYATLSRLFKIMHHKLNIKYAQYDSSDVYE